MLPLSYSQLITEPPTSIFLLFRTWMTRHPHLLQALQMMNLMDTRGQIRLQLVARTISYLPWSFTVTRRVSRIHHLVELNVMLPSVPAFNSMIPGQAANMIEEAKSQPATVWHQCLLSRSRRNSTPSRWYAPNNSLNWTSANTAQEMEVHENSKIYTHFF